MELMLTSPMGFFPSRGAVKAGRLCLSLHREGVLCVSGGGRTRRYPTVNGAVILPPSALTEGENRLLFRSDTCRIPCESLFREGDTVTPAGFDPCPCSAPCPAALRRWKRPWPPWEKRSGPCKGRSTALPYLRRNWYETHKM